MSEDFKWKMLPGHDRTVILTYPPSLISDRYQALYFKYDEGRKWCHENNFRISGGTSMFMLEICFQDKTEMVAFLLKFG